MSDYKFKCDSIFKALIPSLSLDEYQTLAERGCDETAISSVCAKRLEKHRLTEELRKYLIGKRFETEKIISIQNKLYYNIAKPLSIGGYTDISINQTAIRFGEEYNISHVTIMKYGAYANAIDELADKNLNLVKNILTGKIKISHRNVLALSRQTKEYIKQVETQLSSAPSSLTHNIGAFAKVTTQNSTSVSVKTMPDYDPNAELTSLALTIPSWVSSIFRSHINADFQNASQEAKDKLIIQLIVLTEKTAEIMAALKEEV